MTKNLEIQQFPLWDKLKHKNSLMEFSLEITPRCNLNCRHCYINLPAGDEEARKKELTPPEIADLAQQAVDLGAVWCLITGGEPLLRPDFPEIYLSLKQKGLLVSVFTNATLIREEHIALFKRFPPRDIEVTIYGSDQQVYESITRKPGSFAAFERGLNHLFAADVRVRLKAMALRSNLGDMERIAAFGRKYSKDYYRFDPVLHLRYDRNESRNAEIRTERLNPEQVVALERADPSRFGALEKERGKLINELNISGNDDHLFHCGTGIGSVSIGYNGTFKACSSLCAPGTTADLRNMSLKEAYEQQVLQVRLLRSQDPVFLATCNRCPIVNLCLHCPAHTYLETGCMDGETPYFCQVANARAKALANDGTQIPFQDTK